jgi:hypothetical protein
MANSRQRKWLPYFSDVNRNITLPSILMLMLALSRWPGLMPENFSAVYAMAFCAGLYFPGRLVWLPAVTILGSDMVINIFYYRVAPLSVWMLPIYAAYAMIFFLGRRLGSRRSWLALMGGGLAGAILFYLVTNTASWLQLPYAKTLAGWIQALTVGLPNYPHTWEFFRNTMLSGGLFVGLFSGAMKLTGQAGNAESPEEPEAEKEPADEPA